MKNLIIAFLILTLASCTKSDFVIIANHSQFQLSEGVLTVSVLNMNKSTTTYQTTDKSLIKKAIKVIDEKRTEVECGIIFEEQIVTIK